MSTVFADPACTQSVAMSSYTCASRYGITYDLTCDNDIRTRVFALGPAADTTTMYMKAANGACVSSLTIDGFAYYPVQHEIAPEEFVSGDVSAQQ
ncbi:hypothetical protein BE17_10820 [Sorangium cellulosum]|uniref:Uncharacterized protein n=1 Tax=Sorangium cellulosum TaxID=56 RepID=A0A150R8M6_SORCE|nr:hypothetical protein BE17_10820 [Sorangium cellulosum]